MFIGFAIIQKRDNNILIPIYVYTIICILTWRGTIKLEIFYPIWMKLISKMHLIFTAESGIWSLGTLYADIIWAHGTTWQIFRKHYFDLISSIDHTFKKGGLPILLHQNEVYRLMTSIFLNNTKLKKMMSLFKMTKGNFKNQ